MNLKIFKNAYHVRYVPALLRLYNVTVLLHFPHLIDYYVIRHKPHDKQLKIQSIFGKQATFSTEAAESF